MIKFRRDFDKMAAIVVLLLLLLTACNDVTPTTPPPSTTTAAAVAITTAPAHVSVTPLVTTSGLSGTVLAVSNPVIANPLPPPVVMNGHNSAVYNLAWSPDGKVLASSAVNDEVVRLWHSDGNLLIALKGHTGRVRSLAWSPDGKTLATGGVDQTIRLWQPNGMPVTTLNAQAGIVFSLA